MLDFIAKRIGQAEQLNSGTLLTWESSRAELDRLTELYTSIYDASAGFEDILEYETLLFNNRLNKRKKRKGRLADAPVSPYRPDQIIRQAFDKLSIDSARLTENYLRARSHHETFRFSSEFLFVRHEEGLSIFPVRDINTITEEKFGKNILILTFSGNWMSDVKCQFFLTTEETAIFKGDRHINGSEPFLYEVNIKNNLEFILASIRKDLPPGLDTETTDNKENLITELQNRPAGSIFINITKKPYASTYKTAAAIATIMNIIALLSTFSLLLFAPFIIIFISFSLFSPLIELNKPVFIGVMALIIIAVWIAIITQIKKFYGKISISKLKESLSKTFGSSSKLVSETDTQEILANIASILRHFSFVYRVKPRVLMEKLESASLVGKTTNTDVLLSGNFLFILAVSLTIILNLDEIDKLKVQRDIVISNPDNNTYIYYLIAQHKNGIREGYNVNFNSTQIVSSSLFDGLSDSYPNIKTE